jgi:hypothetical protein
MYCTYRPILIILDITLICLLLIFSATHQFMFDPVLGSYSLYQAISCIKLRLVYIETQRIVMRLLKSTAGNEPLEGNLK